MEPALKPSSQTPTSKGQSVLDFVGRKPKVIAPPNLSARASDSTACCSSPDGLRRFFGTTVLHGFGFLRPDDPVTPGTASPAKAQVAGPRFKSCPGPVSLLTKGRKFLSPALSPVFFTNLSC